MLMRLRDDEQNHLFQPRSSGNTTYSNHNVTRSLSPLKRVVFSILDGSLRALQISRTGPPEHSGVPSGAFPRSTPGMVSSPSQTSIINCPEYGNAFFEMLN